MLNLFTNRKKCGIMNLRNKPNMAFRSIFLYRDTLPFCVRKDLNLEEMPFRELFQPSYLGLLAEDDVDETATSRSSVDVEINIRSGCKAKIHAGPGIVKKNGQTDKEVKFIFDQDLFMPGKVPVNYSAGALQTLHSQAYSIFRGAISDTLHNAMEPL